LFKLSHASIFLSCYPKKQAKVFFNEEDANEWTVIGVCIEGIGVGIERANSSFQSIQKGKKPDQKMFERYFS